MISTEALEVAVEAAREGGSVLRHHFRCAGLEVHEKAENDLVSAADRESEAVILEIIRRRFPDHGILSEEEGASGDGRVLSWVVDPLDGTNNFVHGLPFFCVSIALCRRGAPIVGVVYDPVGENLFTAKRGGGAQWNDRPMAVTSHAGLRGAFLATGFPFRSRQALELYLRTFEEVFREARAIRRCGAAALDLAYTAAGVYDGFFEFKLSRWDIAAGVLLVTEAGGTVTDLDGGEEFMVSGNVVAGGAAVWNDLQERVAVHADEAAVARVMAPVDRVSG